MSLVAAKRRRLKRRKACTFCIDKASYVDYKDVMRLRKYITERGKILPRRVTGNCARHQRMMNTAVKRSREIALMPFIID